MGANIHDRDFQAANQRLCHIGDVDKRTPPLVTTENRDVSMRRRLRRHQIDYQIETRPRGKTVHSSESEDYR